ncbi:hypothetical protein CBM2626_A40322 [Cupriavidus taiwanensis]|nr:hypothetical protein CBM2626_A40322 [Cupriavidus taiwanensis]
MPLMREHELPMLHLLIWPSRAQVFVLQGHHVWIHRLPQA